MHRRLLPLVVLPLLAAGCGTDGGTDAAAAGDEPVTVVAAVYPLAWLGSQIAPEADVELLDAGGQEAHDVDLSPPQRAAVETADVVLYTGDIGYQPQVEEAVAAVHGQVVSATEVAGEDALLVAAADTHDEHADEEGGVDPHLWFDPEIMAELAVATGEAFATADPGNAEEYQQNAEAVQEKMAALRADLDGALGGECRFDEAVVSHAAYGYLLEPYGKEQHAVTGVTAESDASAGELAEIVVEIRRAGFAHVLTEPVEGRQGAQTVAEEAGAELLEILPLDAVTAEQADQGLPDLVRKQAESFATALGCA